MKKIKTRLFELIFYWDVSVSIDYVSKIVIRKQGKDLIHQIVLSSNDILEFKAIIDMFIKKDIKEIEKVKNVKIVELDNLIKLKYQEIYLSRFECIMLRDILQSLQKRYFLFKIE